MFGERENQKQCIIDRFEVSVWSYKTSFIVQSTLATLSSAVLQSPASQTKLLLLLRQDLPHLCMTFFLTLIILVVVLVGSEDHRGVCSSG